MLRIIKSKCWEYSSYSLTDFQLVLKVEIFHNEIVGKNKLNAYPELMGNIHIRIPIRLKCEMPLI